MTKILLALLTHTLATEASAQSRQFYDGSGKRIGSATTDSRGTTTFYDAKRAGHRPHVDQQQRHDHGLRSGGRFSTSR